ncbi:phage/plasmid primase, P4 family [Sulfitobacter pontiacus]|uniref:phage/plasmid primase, P4 family n=1 Tax=Sulfitobacter pontiacus TaxID=60137 RepID=UPI002AC8B5A9|nr:phage/plasmid primase, P4 family [Sulfitobacter pontiacus]WPZ24876.1 phage/plasmid primase, P4 family [Sulfitobacter pontiacus]|tara:strand:+ start:5979 stop:7829 length:1851 start_codon:yes stop_codon:yes gene_type:complete
MNDRLDKVRGKFAAAEDVTPVEGLAASIGDASIGIDDNVAPPHDGGDVGPPRTPEEELPPEAQGALYPLNDTGNGKRFALYYGDSALPVPRVGWFAWDGRRWARDPDEIITRSHAQKVQTKMEDEIPFLQGTARERRLITQQQDLRAALQSLDPRPEGMTDEEFTTQSTDIKAKLAEINDILWGRGSSRQRHLTAARSAGNSNTLKNMLLEATVDLARPLEMMDADPLSVNTQSGVLRFRVEGGPGYEFSKTASVDLHPHLREDYITKMMPVDYDPLAPAPLFHAFLERIMPNIEMRQFLQRWLGLSMTSLTGEQKFAFFFGSGANGKSVLIDLIAKMMGDYSATAKIESLTGRTRRGGGDATPDLMPLVGARMVRASEGEEGDRLQEGTIKGLTGGEPIMVRALHSDFIEVHPQFKLTISGNHKPDIRGTDDGIWRRILLVPFDVQIPSSERDEGLGRKLWLERSGILNWLVEGLVDYLEGGLQEPDDVLEATRGYREDSDPIGSFLKDACVVSGDPNDFITARDLIDGFNLWIDMRGEGMWGERTVSNRIKGMANRHRCPSTNKMFSPGKRHVSGYRGIRFTDTFLREYDNAPRNAKGRPVARTTGFAGQQGQF